MLYAVMAKEESIEMQMKVSVSFLCEYIYCRNYKQE